MTNTKEVTECIDACTSTVGILETCVRACEQMGMDGCAQICAECASVCKQHAEGLKEGDHSLAADCIASCETCAIECETHSEMPTCVRSAKACRACITACQQAEQVRA